MRRLRPSSMSLRITGGTPRSRRCAALSWSATGRSCGVERRLVAAALLARGTAPGSPPALVLARAPAPRARRRRGRAGAAGRRRRARLRAGEAAGGHPQPAGHLPAAEAESAEAQDGQLAALRLRPRPHSLPAGEGGEATVPESLALHGPAAARVPADDRRRQALLRQQQRLRRRP